MNNYIIEFKDGKTISVKSENILKATQEVSDYTNWLVRTNQPTNDIVKVYQTS